jgi:uncharacterized protein YdhG (YjbR/CyaY superfamily)
VGQYPGAYKRKSRLVKGYVMPEKNKAVTAFIRKFPPKTRKVLEKMRSVVRAAAPDAEESISYMMPAYKLNGPLAYFSAFRDHIGFFPTGEGVRAFKKQLRKYSVSKGTIRFPLERPVPYGLIKRIIKHRVKQNAGR